MATVKKAQKGSKLKASKDSVPSEMFPGKMIPKTASNYETGKMGKGLSKPAPKKKMKSGGKAFPDLNKDGKVTKADVLVGRGVIKAKKGTSVKKARTGATLSPSKSSTSSKLSTYGRTIGKNTTGKLKMGGSVKKCRYGCK